MVLLQAGRDADAESDAVSAPLCPRCLNYCEAVGHCAACDDIVRVPITRCPYYAPEEHPSHRTVALGPNGEEFEVDE